MTESGKPHDLAPWPGLRVVEEISNGPRQRIWRADLRGRPLVVHQSHRSGPGLDWELKLRAFLRARGVLSPDVLATARGRLRAAQVYVEEFVEGWPPSSEAEHDLVSSAVADLHRLTTGHPQRPGFLSIHDLLAADRGGDVDLTRLPEEVVSLIRHAWRQLPPLPQVVIHADLRPGNLRIQNRHCVLLDWDEAHVDSPLLDLLALPDWEPPEDLGTPRPQVELAALAWEVAACWQLEPEYAMGRLQLLRRFSHQVDGI